MILPCFSRTRLIRTPKRHRSPRGYSLIYAIQVCTAPKGMVFAPLWSENGYRLGLFWPRKGYGPCPLWSGIGMGMDFEEATGVHELICRFDPKINNKKKMINMCELEMDID